jgi:transcriptional regulator with XRE-family HTH domain
MDSDTAVAERAADSDYSDETSTFGDRLLLAREAIGLTQAQLATRIGVKVQTLRNWEEDRSEPRANKFQILAGMLNVSMGWLMSGLGEAPSAQAEGAEGGDMASILADLRGLRGEQARLAEKMARIEKRLRAALAD